MIAKLFDKRPAKIGAKGMRRNVALVRAFFIGALLTSGIVELWASNFFATPVEQLGISALAGAAAVVGAKLAHII